MVQAGCALRMWNSCTASSPAWSASAATVALTYHVPASVGTSEVNVPSGESL